MQEIEINSDSIQVDQFLKWAGIVQTGGHAKNIVAEGFISVNGVIETKRSRKLVPGDEIIIRDIGTFKIVNK